MPESKDYEKVTVLGKGPAISLIDRSSIYIRKYVDMITETANEAGIPWQYRATGSGGTDAGSYHTAQGGTPVIGMAIPCRYIHSPVSVCDIRDYDNMLKLVHAFINKHGEDK
jgi:endoglucanase